MENKNQENEVELKLKKIKKLNIIFISLSIFFLCTTIFFIYGLSVANLNYFQSDELIDQVAYRYNKETDSYMVVGFGKLESNNPRHLTKEEAQVTLVDEIKGKPVTTIRFSAFAGTHIESIVLSKHIERIENSAFSGTPLNNIVWNDKVNYIEAYAFDTTFIEVLNIPKSVKVIEYKAFHLNSALRELTFNSKELEIQSYAFFNSYNLESVTFKGKTTIGDYAFATCRVSNIKFMDDVTIGDHAFYGSGTIQLLSFNGKTKIGRYAFVASYISYIDLTNVISINQYAFSAQIIRGVYFPKNIPNIMYDSFQQIELIYFEGNEEEWFGLGFNSHEVITEYSHDDFLTYIVS